MSYLHKLLRRADRGLVVLAWFLARVGLLLATFREIFDESAYARFLIRRQMVSSREAYSEFLQEHEHAKARRPRCC